MAGYAYSDTPRGKTKKRAANVGKKPGPLATMPGFESKNDGGTRLFVALTQQVQVEERRAQGTLTYILKGAHIDRRNNMNALETVHFNTPVSRARLVPKGKDLWFIVDLRAAATPAWKMQPGENNTALLVIDFAGGQFLSGAEKAPAGENPLKVKSGRTAPPAGKTDAPKQNGTGPNP
jgi:hypothetical protein